MSNCLSNFSISHPMSIQTALFTPNPKHSRLSHLLRKCDKKWPKCVVKAMAAEGTGNLDHLQRINKQKPKKRSAPVAPIGLWDRFPTARTVQQMMDTMDRIIEDPSFAYNGGYPSRLTPAETVGYSRGRTPWEIKEVESEYKLRFDMPGMTKDDVKIWVEEKMLVVKAEKRLPNKKDGEENENGGENEEWSAKSYGMYSSRIVLPENVQFEKIKAEVRDGVLYITIPKASVAAKVFDINVE